MADLLTSFLTHLTYLALVAVLLAASVGVPIPEDIPLVTSGYLCSDKYSPIKALLVDTDHDGKPDTPRRVPHWQFMALAGMIGVLAGDTIVFFIGRRGIDSNNFVARHLRKVLHSRRRERVERHFQRHGYLTVFAGRFMPGLRSLVFGMAGMSKMSYPRFLLVDGLAAAISVPTFVWLGHHYASHFTELVRWIDRTKMVLTPVFIAALVPVAVLYYLRRRRAKAAESLEPVEAVR